MTLPMTQTKVFLFRLLAYFCRDYSRFGWIS